MAASAKGAEQVTVSAQRGNKETIVKVRVLLPYKTKPSNKRSNRKDRGRWLSEWKFMFREDKLVNLVRTRIPVNDDGTKIDVTKDNRQAGETMSYDIDPSIDFSHVLKAVYDNNQDALDAAITMLRFKFT